MPVRVANGYIHGRRMKHETYRKPDHDYLTSKQKSMAEIFAHQDFAEPDRAYIVKLHAYGIGPETVVNQVRQDQ